MSSIVRSSLSITLTSLAAWLVLSSAAQAQVAQLPDPQSTDFCVAVQHTLANTDQSATNTIFDNMPDYRSSKPSVSPLNIYQLVIYAGDLPIIVSCKIKTADHLRSEYGEEAAGKQRYCPDITRALLEQAISELEEQDAEAAETAKNFIVEDTEPYATGQSYLGDFKPSYRDSDGNIHIVTPGLQTDWEDWLFWLLPNRLRGQTYCHLPTAGYLKAIATGEMEPGTVIHTRDDAPTQPASPEAD